MTGVQTCALPILKFVNPVRKCVTSRLPVGLVHFLSYFLSVPLWLFVKIFKGSGDYLKQLSAFKFRHIHSIVFDQLIPKVANYYEKDEAERLLSRFAELENVKIYPVSSMSWTVTAVKK